MNYTNKSINLQAEAPQSDEGTKQICMNLQNIRITNISSSHTGLLQGSCEIVISQSSPEATSYNYHITRLKKFCMVGRDIGNVCIL